MEKNMTKKPKICTIVGPNASGKSDLAIRLAKALGGEIISADSRQVYKGMDLGSGKVSGHFASEEGFAVRVLERDFLLAPTISQEIRHWLIDIVEPQEPFTAAEFQQLSYYLIKAMAQRGKVPLLAGGTGLYIRSVLDGLSFPSVACNEELRKDLERRSTDELRKLLIEKDPEAAETVDINNPRRIIRAIEIIHGTGKSLKDVRTTAPVFFDTLTLGIAMTKEDINSRIRERLERRLKQGMIAEVESLLEKRRIRRAAHILRARVPLYLSPSTR